MNSIQKLLQDLKSAFPDLTMYIDGPDNHESPWFLDVRRPERSFLVVEWRPGVGFGISTLEENDMGSGADEVYADEKQAYDRVVELITSGKNTLSPWKKVSSDQN